MIIKAEENTPEPARISAVFRLPKKDYPDLEDVTVVITEAEDKCMIGVKALGCLPDGRQAWFGDLCHVSKEETVGKFFDSLKTMFKNTETLIQENDKGVKA